MSLHLQCHQQIQTKLVLIIGKGHGDNCKERGTDTISEWKRKGDEEEIMERKPGLSLIRKNTEAISNCFGSMPSTGGLPLTW